MYAPRRQRTVAKTAAVESFGYWSGRDVRLEFRPAAPNAGVTFVRSDHAQAQSPEFLAALARAGRPVYALNYWWEGHGAEDGGPGRGQGRPMLPGNWKQIAVLWDDEMHVWQWSPAAGTTDRK